MRFQMQSEKERHVILFTHMAFDMADPLAVLRPMSVVGKTWAQATKAGALERAVGGKGTVRIHKMTGKFQEERTFPRGEDPRKSKG